MFKRAEKRIPGTPGQCAHLSRPGLNPRHLIVSAQDSPRGPLMFVSGHDLSRIPLSSHKQRLPPVQAAGNDFEHEAERAAQQVMSGPSPQHAMPTRADAGSQGLDGPTRAFFEPRFGHSFAGVRVHVDRAAEESARSMGARAYTVGNHIHFGRGEYQPSAPQGRSVLAHELAHVVQQAPARARGAQRSVAASLSRAPCHAAQRILVATGDAAGFVALANSIIAVQQEVVVSPAGIVSLRATSVQGPPTPEAAELVRVLNTVISDTNTASIEFIHGSSSARPSDARVMVGSFPQSKIDLDDIASFGTQGSVGLGRGRTGGALLSHEITEQHRKQVFREDFGPAHTQGEAAESRAVGGVRGTMTQRQVGGHLEFTVPYTYPGGRVVEVTWDVIDGNVTNVRRRVVTP